MKFFTIALVLLSIYCTTPLKAAIVNWTGEASTDWSNPANWDCNCLPLAGDDVRIGINQTVDISTTDPIRVQALQVRGDLTIGEGSTLEINGQGSPTAGGLQMIIGTLINEGEIIVQQIRGATAFSIGANAVMENNGNVLVRDVICEESSCNSDDAIEIDGELINYGTITLRNTQGMDGVTIRKRLYNEGTFIVDTIQNNSLNTFALSRGASLENTLDASLELKNVIGLEGISRGLSNVQDSVTIINAGEIRLLNLNENILALDTRGNGTSVSNTGGITIQGGKVAAIFQQGMVFENEGELHCTGQTQYGIRTTNTVTASNTGTISLTEGSVITGIQINGGDTAYGLVNTGTITINAYTTSGSTTKIIDMFSGRLMNEGVLEITGGGQGRGLQASENTLVANTGTIFLDSLNYGCWLVDGFTNQGTLNFGPAITQRPLNDNAIVENSGTIAGFGVFAAGVVNFLNGSTLVPGNETVSTTLVFANNLLLPAEATILLDLSADAANPDRYDWVRAEEEFSFSGEMTVQLTTSFNLSTGSFTLLQGGAAFNGTPVINLPDPPAGSDWRIEQTATAIILHLDIINDLEDVLITDQENYCYPNPVKSASMVRWVNPGQAGEIVDFVLFNGNGQQVGSWQNEGSNASLTMPVVPAGIYTLRWRSKDRWGSQQLVIQP